MDLEDDFEMAGYSLSFPEWKYSLGYMVADNTQENIMDLLIQYLEEASSDGFNEQEREEKLQKKARDLEKMEPLSF